MSKAELSIIIVNWNGVNFLPNCLTSIVENQPTVPFEIIVVDNCSTDGSREWLSSDEANELLKNAQFKLILSDENMGFGRANNLAIEQSNSPFVFLLNPDTIVQREAITKLLDTLRSNERIGAVAPRLLSQNGSVQVSVWGFPPTPVSLLVQGFQLDRFLPNKLLENWIYASHWNYLQRVSVPMVSGAAIMVKKAMINAVGAFDPEFHMYGEDGEWCIRMKRHGWLTVFEPDASIIHLGGQSSMQRWGLENSKLKEQEAFILFQKKCLPRYLVILNLVTRLFIFSIYFLKNLIGRKDNTMSLQLIELQLSSIKSLAFANASKD
jgi:GT2 family glycosyltransferase